MDKYVTLINNSREITNRNTYIFVPRKTVFIPFLSQNRKIEESIAHSIQYKIFIVTNNILGKYTRSRTKNLTCILLIIISIHIL